MQDWEVNDGQRVALPPVRSIAWNRPFQGTTKNQATITKRNIRRGRIHNGRAADAQGRLEDHVSLVSAHGRELRGQDRGRSRGRADHDRAEALAGAVRSARVLLLP